MEIARRGRHGSWNSRRLAALLAAIVAAAGQLAAQTEPGPRRLLVDPTLSERQAEAHPYVFRTVQEAVAHLTPGTGPDDRTTLLLKPAVYWIDDPDDPEVRVGDGRRPPVALTVDCPWLSIVGLGEQPDDVVLACNRGQTQGAVGNFTMLSFHGDGLHLQNLTLGNYCNVDLEYPLDTTQNRPRRADAITQAQLAFADGDRLTATDCRFVSRLNTCPLNGGHRTVFTRCSFECTDDALEGRALYRQCRFRLFSGKPFYATSRAGAILLDCDFRVESDVQYVTKMSSPVLIVGCRFEADHPVRFDWTPYPEATLRCYAHANTLNGQPLHFPEAHTVDLEGTPLLEDLLGLGELPTQALFDRLGRLVVHEELEPAACTVMGDSVVGFARRRFALGDLTIDSCEGPHYRLHNDDDTTRSVVLICPSATGVQATALATLHPTPMPAPVLSRHPRLKRVGEGRLQLVYRLPTEGRRDESMVSWYRGRTADDPQPLLVAVSRDGVPADTYTLQAGDVGCFLKAVIEPKHQRSLVGPPVAVDFGRAIGDDDVVAPRRMDTDFRQMPTNPQPLVAPGTWTLDGYKPADTAAQDWQAEADSWYYGRGTDGARGTGLLQKAKGARLRYTPTAGQLAPTTSTMSLTLMADPCKTAGQGFGSATDQYMDVCLHFDTNTLTGYALRIVRTPKYANAVDMMLMRYDHGRAIPIGNAVSTTCFLTGCTIRLWTETTSKGGLQLCAHVGTTSEQRQSQLAKEVNLRADIDTPTHHGLAIQHTGSVGANAIMLHRLCVEWNP